MTKNKTDATCAQCGGTDTYEKTSARDIADCMGDTWECRDCEESYSPAEEEPTKEELLKALRDMVNSYDDTGCAGVGVVDQAVFAQAEEVLEKAKQAGMY